MLFQNYGQPRKWSCYIFIRNIIRIKIKTILRIICLFYNVYEQDDVNSGNFKDINQNGRLCWKLLKFDILWNKIFQTKNEKNWFLKHKIVIKNNELFWSTWNAFVRKLKFLRMQILIKYTTFIQNFSVLQETLLKK